MSTKKEKKKKKKMVVLKDDIHVEIKKIAADKDSTIQKEVNKMLGEALKK